MALGETIGRALNGKREICQACGAEFGCGALLKGCWCWKVDVPKAALSDLRERYQRCLCPDCLKRAVAEGAGR